MGDNNAGDVPPSAVDDVETPEGAEGADTRARNVHDKADVASDDPRLASLIMGLPTEQAPPSRSGSNVDTYLATIGHAPRLLREGEVRIGMRIEAARQGLSRCLYCTPLFLAFIDALLPDPASPRRRRRTRDGRAVEVVREEFARVLEQVPPAFAVVRAQLEQASETTNPALDDVRRLFRGECPRSDDPFAALAAAGSAPGVVAAWEALTEHLDHAVDLTSLFDFDRADVGDPEAIDMKLRTRLARVDRQLQSYDDRLEEVDDRNRAFAGRYGLPLDALPTDILADWDETLPEVQAWRDALGLHEDDDWERVNTHFYLQGRRRARVEKARRQRLGRIESSLWNALGVDGASSRAPIFDERTWRDVARIAQAFHAQREEAARVLVQVNGYLVIAIARQNEQRGLPFEDLVWTGHLGLTRAVQAFSYRRGYGFGAYARRGIRQAIELAVQGSACTRRLSDDVVPVVGTLARGQRSLTRELGRTPTQTEISIATGLPVSFLRRLQVASARPSPRAGLRSLPPAASVASQALVGHTAPVRGAVQLSGGRIVSWSDDTTLRIWDAEGGAVGACVGHADGVGGVRELGGERLLSWSDDGTLCIWEGEGGSDVDWEGHLGAVRGTTRLPGGGWVSWSEDGTLRMWDRDGRTARILDGHTSPVCGVLVLEGGGLLSWAQSGDPWLWNADGSPRTTIGGHTSAVLGAIQMPGGRIVTWSSDHLLCVWETDASLVAELVGHTKRVRGAFALQEGRLLSWAEDGTLRLWDVEEDSSVLLVFSEEEEDVLPEDEDEELVNAPTTSVKGARTLPDGRIVAWDDLGNLALWDATGTRTFTLESLGRGGIVVEVTPLANGGWVAWSSGGQLTLVHGQQYLCIATPPGHRGQVCGVTKLDDGRWLGWTSADMLRVLDGSTGTPLALFDAAEAYREAPDLYRAWRSAVGASSVLPTGVAEGTSEGTTVDLGTGPFHESVRWFASGTWSADDLQPDGTLVARRGRDVAVLHLYDGDRRISVEAAEALASVRHD